MKQGVFVLISHQGMFVFERCQDVFMLVNDFDLTLTLMIQDSGPSSHRTMFRFSKLKLIGLGVNIQGVFTLVRYQGVLVFFRYQGGFVLVRL